MLFQISVSISNTTWHVTLLGCWCPKLGLGRTNEESARYFHLKNCNFNAHYWQKTFCKTK